MALLNLTKDGRYIFNKKVSSVKFYDKNDSAKLLGEAGHMGKAGVKINAVPRTTELIGSNKYQLGYDVSVEIISEQLYGMFEFDKLKNKNAYIEFPELPLFVNIDTTLNVEVMADLGATQGQVKITCSGYAETLQAAFFTHWFGLVLDPWATPLVDDSPAAQATGEFHYALQQGDPLIEIVTPAAPEADDPITEVKLSLYDENYEVVMLEPTVTAVEYFDGFTWTALVVTTDYTVIFEDEIYKVHIDTAQTVLLLKTRIRVKYTIS